MILMELMSEGSLQNVLEHQPDKLSLRRKLTMARQIASGMRRIHEHGMIHRDIRPDNILVNEKYIAKIGDMGIARVLDPTGRQTQIGCTEFMPPEFFDDSTGRIKCDEKLDIYTYGLTLNQMFTETMHDFRFSSPFPTVTLRKESVVFFDEIISPCLEKDPRRRPTALEIERTLTMYEQAFGETMLTDEYIKMGTKEKDRFFIEFYQNNRSRIQRFLRAQLPSQLPKEIPVQMAQSKRSSPLPSTPSDTPLVDNCRINWVLFFVFLNKTLHQWTRSTTRKPSNVWRYTHESRLFAPFAEGVNWIFRALGKVEMTDWSVSIRVTLPLKVNEDELVDIEFCSDNRLNY